MIVKNKIERSRCVVKILEDQKNELLGKHIDCSRTVLLHQVFEEG